MTHLGQEAKFTTWGSRALPKLIYHLGKPGTSQIKSTAAAVFFIWACPRQLYNTVATVIGPGGEETQGPGTKIVEETAPGFKFLWRYGREVRQ